MRRPARSIPLIILLVLLSPFLCVADGLEVIVVYPGEEPDLTIHVGVNETDILGAITDPPAEGDWSWEKVTGPGEVTWTNENSPGPHFEADECGTYTVRASFSGEAGSGNDTSGSIYVFGPDLDIDGIDEQQEADPGGFLEVDGDRRKISLALESGGSLPEGNLTLSVIGDEIELWTAATGGEEQTTFYWEGGEGFPSELWVQAVDVSDTPRDVALNLLFEVTDEDAEWSYWYAQTIEDQIRFTVVTVKIKQDGNDITGTTHDEIVGKKINLTGQVVPPDLTISSRQWSIPGLRIKNYEADQESGTVIALAPGDLDDASVTFYWVDGGDGRHVQYTVSVEGTPFHATATFDVKRPTSTMSTNTSSVGINEGTGAYFYGLRFGDASTSPETAGIEFTCSINVPDGFAGTTKFVQLYTYDRRRRLSSPSHPWQRLQGTGLDHFFPHGSGTFEDDLPSEQLIEGLDRMEIDDSACMWFMFKPSGADGILVPLRKVDWWWQGTAHRVQDNEWNLDSASNSQNPSSVDTTQHPEWTHNIADDDWESE